MKGRYDMTRMMKKLTAVLLAMTLVLSLTPVSAFAAGQAVRFAQDGLEYLGNDSGLAVISCNEKVIGEDIDIPETVTYQGKTYTVTDIGSGAFYDLAEGFSVKSVTIPASVGSIGSAAFKNCQKLETVTFAPGSMLTELSDRVFEACYSLKSVNIPDGVTSIGSRAFYYCALKGITLPDGLTDIGDEAFCLTMLSSVTIPASVQFIGSGAFDTGYSYDLSTHSFYKALNRVCYNGSKSEWEALVSGKDVGIGSAAVYTNSTITFDTMGQGTAPDPVTVGPLVKPRDVVGIEGPYAVDGEYAVEAWYEDEALTKPFDFSSILTDDVTVYAKWGDRKYTVTVRTLSGATVEKSRYKLNTGSKNSFLPGTDMTITIYPFYITDLYTVLLEGVRLDNRLSRYTYSFTMPHHDAALTFVNEDDPSYPVTVQREPAQGGNAFITGGIRSAIEGEKLKLDQWAYEGYRFKEWQVTDGVTVDDDGTFTMPAEAVTVTAVFEPEYTVIWLDGDGSRLMSAVYYSDEDEPITDLIPVKADEGCYSYTFEGWDEGALSGNTKTYTPIFSRTLKDIPLWLGDTQITAENLADIPSVTEGKASFDPETNTLTLDNVKKISGKHNDAILCSGLERLTVELKGENRFNYFIYGANDDDFRRELGIISGGELVFAGGGSLSLEGFEQSIRAYGSPVTVDSGALSISMSWRHFGFVDYAETIDCGAMLIRGGSLSIDGYYTADGNPMEASGGLFGSDSSYYAVGIRCNSFLMTGGSFSTANCETGVWADDIVIEGGQADLSARFNPGLYSMGDITVGGLDTDLRISSDCNDAVYAKGTLTLTDDVCVASPEGAYIASGTVIDQSGSHAGEVRIATKTHRITIDVGDLGDDITVAVRHGSNFFDALNAQDTFGALCELDTDDCVFRDLATRPLSEFADQEEFSDDAEALLKKTVTADMKVYACFYRKIKNVELTLVEPIVGTTVTVTESDGIFDQTPAPEVTVEPGAHCSVSEGSAEWFAEDEQGGFTIAEGAFKPDVDYCVELLLMPDFGWWLDDDTVVTANGAKVDGSSGAMVIYVHLLTQAVPLLGDADCDGEVSILDATAIQRRLAGFSVKSFSESAARVLGNELSILDATVIQRYLAGIESPAGMGQPIR